MQSTYVTLFRPVKRVLKGMREQDFPRNSILRLSQEEVISEVEIFFVKTKKWTQRGNMLAKSILVAGFVIGVAKRLVHDFFCVRQEFWPTVRWLVCWSVCRSVCLLVGLSHYPYQVFLSYLKIDKRKFKCFRNVRQRFGSLLPLLNLFLPLLSCPGQRLPCIQPCCSSIHYVEIVWFTS